jgi:glutamyl/glutaminyl-tRNA synthetase
MTGTPSMTGTPLDFHITGRFAPSPTGRLHLGNIASMLVAWLAAKVHRTCDGHEIGAGTQHPGKVVLRFEDIDRPRTVLDADQWTMDDLTWLGLTWNGTPIWQSQRLNDYASAIHDFETLHLARPRQPEQPQQSDQPERLVYPCFCSRRELHEASAPQSSDGFFVYPGTCRHFATIPASSEQLQRQHSLRLAFPCVGSPDQIVSFSDAVFGIQSWDLPDQVGDTVIRRSDGLFAYQLAVVVDDVAQGVNQIVRGRDLLRSVAIQSWVRRCLLASHAGLDDPQEWAKPVITSVGAGVPTPQAPEYLHIPLVCDMDGKRMAKRSHSYEIETLRAHHVPPDAVIGYVAALLGLTDPPQGNQGDLRHFEPCMPSDLLKSLDWPSLIARLHGPTVTPRSDVRADPKILLARFD